MYTPAHRIGLQWRRVQGRPASQSDVDAIYRDFQVTQLAVLDSCSHLTPGSIDALGYLRARGARVATTSEAVSRFVRSHARSPHATMGMNS